MVWPLHLWLSFRGPVIGKTFLFKYSSDSWGIDTCMGSAHGTLGLWKRKGSDSYFIPSSGAHSLTVLNIDVSFPYLLEQLSASWHHIAKHANALWLLRTTMHSQACFSRFTGVRVITGCCFKLQVLLTLTPCNRLSSGLLYICLFWDPGWKGSDFSWQWQRHMRQAQVC